MSHQAGLDISDTGEVLRKYQSQAFNGDSQQIANAMAMAAQIPSSTEWSHSIETGGRAALQFLQNKTGRPAAFFALAKMLGKTESPT